MSGAPHRFELAAITEAGEHAVNLAVGCLAEVGNYAARHDAEASYVREAHARLASAGLMGATVPLAFGGLGVTSLHDVAAVLERVATADASAALALHMQLSRGLSTARLGDTADGAAQLLRGMADGSVFVAGAVGEVGGSYFTVGSTVSRTADGGWALSGEKVMVTGAPVATHFAVRARIDTDTGPRLGGVIVARTDGRVLVESGWDGLGMRGSGSERVRFERAPILPWSLAVHGEWGRYDRAALGGRIRSSAAMLGIYLGLGTAARHQIAVALDRRASCASDRTSDQRSGPAEGLAGRPTEGPAFVGTLGPAAPQGWTWRADALADATALLDRVAKGVRDVLLAVDDMKDSPATTLTVARDWQQCRLELHEVVMKVSDLALSVVGAGGYRSTSPVSRILRDCRAGQFMQPYGPAQAQVFLASSGEGIDPGLLE